MTRQRGGLIRASQPADRPRVMRSVVRVIGKRDVRAALLSVAGLSCVCVAAFLLHHAAGWAAVGVSLLLLDWLSRDDG